jgi:hypothetical protein
VLVAPYFGCLSVCVCVCRVAFSLDGEDVDFGDDCCFINRFKPAVNKVNGVSSSWKTYVQLWIEKKESLFGDFGTSVMILQ